MRSGKVVAVIIKAATASSAVCLFFALVANAFASPKKTVAVIQFDNKSGWRGSWEIGWGMQEMLATALVESGRFTVLERQELGGILTEQNLAASGRSAEGAAAAIGQLGRAQIAIAGAITEFEHKAGGEGAGVRVRGIRLGGSQERAHVALNMRLIDTTTGEVLDSIRVAGSAASRGLKVGYSSSDFGGDIGGFRKTPLGEATQEAIDEAVKRIIDRMAGVPWQAKVIRADASQVFINAGSDAGVTAGTEFSVYREGEVLTDPDTGMVLGAISSKVGRIRINSVQDKFAVASILEGAGFERNDIVREE